MSLSGRVAVITGASSGIGLACAEQLASQGVAVMLGARRADRLQAAVDGIQAKGGRAAWVAMDVTFELEVNELVKRARELFGGLDIMICNAGFGFYGSLEDTPPDVMRRMMEVNFTGSYLGGAGGAADLPGAAARTSDPRLLDRRTPRHSVHERLLGNEGRTSRIR